MHHLCVLHPELPNFPAEEPYCCDHCGVFKATQQPVKQPAHKHINTTKIWEWVFFNTAGPFKTASSGGAYYFTTFINKLTKTGKVYLLLTKAANYEAFLYFLIEIGQQPGKLCIFRNSNTAEFTSKRMAQSFPTSITFGTPFLHCTIEFTGTNKV